MKKKIDAIVFANFGGPRDISEVEEFLKELLTDRDVIWTSFPDFIHRFLFGAIAKKRAKKVSEDYQKIGGKSPIFEDTERLANAVQDKLGIPIICFHRYLPKTHNDFIQKLKNLNSSRTLVFPLYPQFSYATTGSIARWFDNNLCREDRYVLEWIKSYPISDGFINPYIEKLRNFLQEKKLDESEVGLLFSAHGVPKKFTCFGDDYQKECEYSFQEIVKHFPKAASLLCYQSKFGKGEWLRPYTSDVAEKLPENLLMKKAIILIPLSFTSDHIETLFEIEEQYLPPIRAQGKEVFRLPALGLDKQWVEGIVSIIKNAETTLGNAMLIRGARDRCCNSCSHCCNC